MPFYEIEFPLTGLDADAVEAALEACGASSTTFLDRGDEPVLEPLPGEIRLWSDTLVRALFDEHTDTQQTLRFLADRFGPQVAADARVTHVADQAWERAWLKDWKPMQFGAHLWVCPTDAAAPPDPAAVVVRLDPGLAFGTGTHATTALCLEALADTPLRGKSVVDYGCGSGILAIAALKLGASRVIGVDLDPQALLASRENALRNEVSNGLTTQDTTAPVPCADIVLANILAGTLLELRPLLTDACVAGGQLLMSGILHAQADEVAAAYRPWFDRVERVTRDDWCLVRARGRRVPIGSGAR